MDIQPPALVSADRRLQVIDPDAIIDPTFEGSSADVSRLFLRPHEALDGNGSQDDLVVYVAGRYVGLGVGAGSSLPGFSADGQFAVVNSSAVMDPGDQDNRLDLYRVSTTDPADRKLITLGTTTSGARFEWIADDGSSVVFESREALTAEDAGTDDDFYQWDAATGSIRLLTLSVLDPQFIAATPDGSHVLFQPFGGPDVLERVGDDIVKRGEGSYVLFSDDGSRLYFSAHSDLVPEDNDGVVDAYWSDASGFHLMTGWTDEYVGLIAVSPDEARVLIGSSGPLVPEDTDMTGDLYMVESGQATLVTQGSTESRFEATNRDLTTLVYSTFSQIAEGDPNDTNDLYLWQESDPSEPELLTPGHGGDNSATIRAISDDGARIVFDTRDAMPGEVGTGYPDLYEWIDGTTTNLTPDTPEHMQVLAASPDGSRIVFWTNAQLLPDDAHAGGTYISDADVVPPAATVERVSGVWGSAATFELGTVDNDGASFECTLDGGEPTPCGDFYEVEDLAGGEHELSVVAFDAAGNASDSVVANWIVKRDDDDPLATKPSHALLAGKTIESGKVPMRLSWTGSDATSGLARYELSQSTNGGTWASVSTDLTKATLDRPLAPGHTYRFRVRAIDHAGNVGSWATGLTFTLSRYSEASSRITYGGTWRTTSSTAYWGGAAKYASTAGARATFTFTGKSIAWVARKGPGRGKAEILVNGTRVATVDLYASSYLNQRVVWSKSWSTATKRTVVVRLLGTTGRPRVDLDALVTTN